MDAASESAKIGLYTRDTRLQEKQRGNGAYEFEYDLTKGTGVKGLFNVAPLEIRGNGKVRCSVYSYKKLKTGKLKIFPGSEFFVDVIGWLKLPDNQNKCSFTKY